MVWTISYSSRARAQLKKLDKLLAKRIIDFLQHRVAARENPRSIGETLTGATLGNFWKYRVGDYRIIADIQDKTLTILVVRVGNRRTIYKTS